MWINVTQIWSRFTEIMNDLVQKCVPVTKQRDKRKPAWMNKRLSRPRKKV